MYIYINYFLFVCLSHDIKKKRYIHPQINDDIIKIIENAIINDFSLKISTTIYINFRKKINIYCIVCTIFIYSLKNLTFSAH